MWRWTVSPEAAPDAAEYVDLEFEKGDLVAINGTRMKRRTNCWPAQRTGRQARHRPARSGREPLRRHEEPRLLRDAGRHHPVAAHRAIESITLDREVAHLKDDLMPRYASLIYNGYWWSPERHALQALIDHTQQSVNGWVRVKLYKGNVIVTGRDSKTDSLFDPAIATFEDDAGAYDPEGRARIHPSQCAAHAHRVVRKGGVAAIAADTLTKWAQARRAPTTSSTMRRSCAWAATMSR
jgi:argininosuccinate synthase